MQRRTDVPIAADDRPRPDAVRADLGPVARRTARGDGQFLIDDAAAFDEQPLAGAERLAVALAASGFPAVIVNPTMPIGPYDRNLTPPGRMIRNFLLGKIKGYLECTLNLIDVRDVAMGHYLAAKHGVPGRRHILAGHNMTIRDFFAQMAAICGRPPPSFKVPYTLAVVFSYLEEWYGRLTGREPLSSVTGVRLCRRSLAFDGTQTWRLLGGHTIRQIDSSLIDAVEWHRQKLAAEGIMV